MDRFSEKQFKKLEKQEAKFLKPKPINVVTQTIDSIEEKIPVGLRVNLEAAFYQAFKLVFSKGNLLIEKTFNKEKHQIEFEIRDYRYDKNQKKQAMREFKKNSASSRLAVTGATAAEGALLGVLGIGLPDIPVFMGVLLKGIYETAMNYGFSYEDQGERYLILLLLEAAVSDDENKLKINKQADAAMADLEAGILTAWPLEEQMKKTSQALAADMLCAKFIQGLPVVGMIGGVANASYFIRITSYADMKYKKRYLLKKQQMGIKSN